MLRIAALNDSSSDSDSDNDYGQPAAVTKEAQESEAFNLYNKALSLQRQGDLKGAEQVFRKILNSELILKAVNDEDEGLVDPGLVLKYSTYKNLASMAMQKNDYNAAMEAFLQAVMVDSTDVTVWYKIGMVALKIHKYPLARHAFEQGLECNNKHWPCLDQLITVLYALNNYAVCLYYIAMALERDCEYLKGLVFRKKIYSEQFSLRPEFLHLFEKCDPSIDTAVLEDEDMDEYVNEALKMRQKKRELSREPDLPVLPLPKFKSFTWKNLGENLVSLYDSIATAESPVSFTCKVDMTRPCQSESSMATSTTSVVMASTHAPILLAALSPTQTGSITAGTPVISQVTDVINQTPSMPSSSSEQTPADHTSVSEISSPMQTPISQLLSASTDTSILDLSATEKTNDTSTPMEIDDGSIGRKRGPKRKRLQMGDDPSGKRRSARVRGASTKKQEEVVNLQELLLKFLPSSLIKVHDENQTEAMDLTVTTQHESDQINPAAAGVTTLSSERGSVTDDEHETVKKFMKSCETNGGVIDVINRFLIQLAKRANVIWPDGLAEVYIKSYARIRKHIDYPSFLGRDVPESRIRDMAMMGLVYAELKLDQWLTSKSHSTLSPGSSPRKSPGAPMHLGPDFPGQYYTGDLNYLVAMTATCDILEEFWPEYCVRVFWLRARFHMLQNKMEQAVDSFDKTSLYLTEASDEEKPMVVRLPVCKTDNNVTVDEVKKQYELLKRCQSLEEVHRLHDAGNHNTVVDLLLLTFTQPQQPERHAQLLLLQDSLLKMNDYGRCLLWGEVSFNEALQHYKNTHGTSKEEWLSTMTQLFAGLDKCLAKDNSIIGTLPSKSLVRLTENLIHVIEIAMDVPDFLYEMNIPTPLPWMLLYRLIDHEERKLHSLASGMKEDLTDLMPSSLMVLNIAHEYLGRRSWCVNSDGALLLFMIDVMIKEFRQSSTDGSRSYKKDNLEQSIEQCFYCLYGHPNKRTKAKHLQDHNVPQINLTWERAEIVFQYFKPKNVPEFDSYKTSTVSAELENMLRRISVLVPTQENPANTIESVTAYIDGAINMPPAASQDKPVTLPIVKELYYLLADYYFKNKEQAKAIKFYLHDLCVNPERFDSWAGMALARSSRLEQKLNSHELKTDGPIQKHAIAALRCFKRALEIDDTNSKLWIEYGSLAYMLHSHAARQLKQNEASIIDLSPEVEDLAISTRKEMLRIAQNCYIKASESEAEDNEEEWLNHYMLGKIAEKMTRPPKEYMDHYRKAAHHLHEDYANYPKKINYIYSPPRLAVEALEMYYRLHVAISKYLIRHEDEAPLDLFEQYIQEAADGPFASSSQKRVETKERDASVSLDDEGSNPSVAMETPGTATHAKKKKVPTATLR